MIRVMLVDDHPVLRRGIIQLIELEDKMTTVCEANNGQQAISMANVFKPDLILLDLNMKGMNGIETINALKQAGVTSKIALYTVSDTESDVIQAIRAGADGYLLKDTEPEELIEQIIMVAAGKFVISAPLTALLAKALRPDHHKTNIIDSLTARERQIWQCIATGMSNKVIARQLGIAETTVKVHVKNLLRKIQLKTRIEAALFAVKNKLFT